MVGKKPNELVLACGGASGSCYPAAMPSAQRVYVGLLRAVNVGGTGKLAMSDLKALCEKAGFDYVRTYIASGNVVFVAQRSEADVKATLEKALETHMGKNVGVLVRTVTELAAVLEANPFADAPPNRVIALFLDAAPPPDTLETITGRNDERIALGTREIYVHYGDGMADSKLKIPAAKTGTGRNINTVSKLVEMARALETEPAASPRTSTRKRPSR